MIIHPHPYPLLRRASLYVSGPSMERGRVVKRCGMVGYRKQG